MFQEALQKKFAIVLCYNKQTTMRLINQVHSLLTWQPCQIIVNCLSPIVFACILNQSCGHWLLSDALHSTISMSLKLKKENQVVLSFESLMEEDSIIVNELALLVFNIRKEVCGVLDFFLSFLTKYKNKKTLYMISLMLDLRFKSLQIIFSFVGWEQIVSLVEEYDRKILYLMLVKCYEHLHPLIRSNINFVDQYIFYQDCNLDILNKLQVQANQQKNLSRESC
jgi:hypothetical protein